MESVEKLFIDKYQPIYFKDFEIEPKIIDIFKTLINMDGLNILLIGDMASGKTSLLNAIIREYYNENNPKDYFLRHNGAGQFEIRRRVDIAPVYDKNNNPMIFYAKDLFNIANQININVEEEAMKSALKAQEKMQGRERQQAETGFGVTGP